MERREFLAAIAVLFGTGALGVESCEAKAIASPLTRLLIGEVLYDALAPDTAMEMPSGWELFPVYLFVRRALLGNRHFLSVTAGSKAEWKDMPASEVLKLSRNAPMIVTLADSEARMEYTIYTKCGEMRSLSAGSVRDMLENITVKGIQQSYPNFM